MMLLEIKEVLNGDMYINFETYKCDRCGEHLDESMPRTHESNETHFCWDCSFILSHINEEEYLKNCGITLLNMNAAVNHKGEIEIWTGNKVPPWERSDR